jgi:hypothetical protein
MENNKQQTEVDWLFAELKNHLDMPSNQSIEILEQAKEMEKDRLEKAYDAGHSDGHDACYGHGATYQSFDEYYNETYGGGEQ